MRVLITGALGHIGSKFIHSLVPGAYDEVVLLDNLSTQRYCSLFDLPRQVPFRFVKQDLCTGDLIKLFEGIDAVVHLAAVTDAVESFANGQQVERVNFEGTIRVAEACIASGCRLVLLSTTSVYGTQKDVVDESCSRDELKPQSPYAASKLQAEEWLQNIGRPRGLRFVICRFGTIFGPSIGMRFHTAINKFVLQAVLGEPLTVWRTALEQKRPYLDVEDAVRALRFVVDGDHFDGGVYNVLTANATVRQIVDVIRARIPDVEVKLVDERIMNQLSYEVLCDRFRALGFTPTGRLDRGIEATIDLLASLHGLAADPSSRLISDGSPA